MNPERSVRLNKFSRLFQRLQDPEWRKYAGVLIVGKFGAIAILMMAFFLYKAFTGDTAHADDPVLKGNDIVNPLNTLWVLVTAFLVFCMQVGFTMLEAGFCRSRETVNVLVECVFDTCLCGLLYWAWGFAFMFGHGNGFIGSGDAGGHNWYFLHNTPETYETTGVSFMAFWLFQFAFADCASTICSGSMIGRTAFMGDILYSVCVSGFIYPIIGHWAWGPDGFLLTMGSAAAAGAPATFLPTLGNPFRDFAGSTVVHAIGGSIALAGAIVLGPRLGRKFKRDGGGPMLPHDLVIACVGGLILWFGWYGFNPGSSLSAMDFQGVGRIAANTTLAACAGGMVAVLVALPMTKKWDLGFMVNGFLAGLVAITCPCYWVDSMGSVLIGGIAGAIVVGAIELLEYLRIDDPIGAVPVHLVNGIWGTIALGLFACGRYNSTGSTGATAIDKDHPALAGLFYHGGTGILQAQIIGNLIVVASTFSLAMLMFFIIHKCGLLRVSKAGELEGLDVHEHGLPAYPEFALHETPTAHEYTE